MDTRRPRTKGSAVFSQAQSKAAWTSASTKVETYSNALVKRWNKEIDTYLVFAALFSAILTAFNIESYRLLRPGASDSDAAVLERISFQLASFSVNPSFINSTHTARPRNVDADSVATIPHWQIQLNTLWFSSLILSLASASISIMIKQWLNEYTRGVFGTSREASRLRQHRLNNLQRWRVAAIVATVPILLQIALALFLAGTLVLLWNLQHTVAIASSVLVGLLALFTIITIVLPLIRRNCPFVSPLTLALHSVKRLVTTIPTLRSYLRTLFLGRWKQLRNISIHVSPTWKALEQRNIREVGTSLGLDIDVLVSAYDNSLSPEALVHATTCLLDLDNYSVVDYYRKLYTALEANYGFDGVTPPLRPGSFAWKGTHSLLWTRILSAIVATKAGLQPQYMYLLWECCSLASFPSTMTIDEATWILSACYRFVDVGDSQAGEETVSGKGEISVLGVDVLYGMILRLIQWDRERRQADPTIPQHADSSPWNHKTVENLADETFLKAVLRTNDASPWDSQLEEFTTYLHRTKCFLRFARLNIDAERRPLRRVDVEDSDVIPIRIQHIMDDFSKAVQYYYPMISPATKDAKVPIEIEKLEAVFRDTCRTLQDVLGLIDDCIQVPRYGIPFADVVTDDILPALKKIHGLLRKSALNDEAFDDFRSSAYSFWFTH